MTDIKEIPVNALVRLPRHMLEVEIGGPRLVTVSRGLGEVMQPPDASSRSAAHMYLYQINGSMGPEPGLVFSFDPTGKQAGNDVEDDVRLGEEEPFYLEFVGSVPMGFLWTPSGKLSMISADMSQEFMNDAVIPHDLLLPKRVPASLRISKYWQLWVSL